MNAEAAQLLRESEELDRELRPLLDGEIADRRGLWLRRQAQLRTDELRGLTLDDQGSGARLLLLHGDGLRYCEALGGWLRWDGSRWIEDALGVERLAADVQGLLLAEAEQASGERRTALAQAAARSGSGRALREALFCARSRVAADLEDFDAHPELLNFSNGSLDLDTLAFRNARREDLLTKAVPCRYWRGAPAQRWLRFVSEVTRGDEELAAYLQRAAGSALLGRVRDHKVFIGYGPGGAGKGTFCRALHAALGPDYCQEAPPSLLLKRGRDAHPTGLADLRGKRLVTVEEVGQGREFDLELLKRLSGGDRIRARHPFLRFFEFTPSHHLLIFANHLPRITESSRAVWRRITVMPFLNVVPTVSMDLDLDAKLAAEAEGVMDWLVEGFRLHRELGLGTCRAVEEATAEYRAASDALGRFIEERCVLHAEARIRAGVMLQALNGWLAEQGLGAWDSLGLAEAMQERGIEKRRSNGIWYQRIGLEASE